MLAAIICNKLNETISHIKGNVKLSDNHFYLSSDIKETLGLYTQESFTCMEIKTYLHEEHFKISILAKYTLHWSD